jgi:CubicO group peptidase (beta-lactamase class C family)
MTSLDALTAGITLALACTSVAAQTRPDGATVARAVDSLAARAVQEGLAPALGVAIAMDGSVVYAKSHGMADVTAGVAANDRTLWYVASTSKSYTGFGVALLAERGVIRIDAPITSLLPAVKWHAGARADQLTLGHFLSHTHNLNDNAVVQSAAFTGAMPETQWPQLVALATPTGGNDLVYSNFGYNIAAMVIDTRQMEGWKRFLEQAVYRPAGLHDTHTRISGLDPRRIARPHRLQADGRYATEPFMKTDVTMNSAGGHLATLSDLARWTIVQMDSGRIDGRQVFPQAAVALSHQLIARQTREQAKRFAFFDREGWGAGWDIGTYEGERMVSRFGGYHSLRSHVGFLPRRRIGVVAMSTGGAGSSVTDVLAAFAYDLEAGRPDAHAKAEARLTDLRTRLDALVRGVATSDSTRAARQRQPLDRPLSDYTGRFSDHAFGEVAFTLRDGRLGYSWGVLRGPAEILDASRHQMRIEIAGSGTPVSFDLSGPGAAQSIQIQGVTFNRIPRSH